MRREKPIPPMPEGFHDQTAWNAIHWQFNPIGQLSTLDGIVMGWQLENQERVLAAIRAESGYVSEQSKEGE